MPTGRLVLYLGCMAAMKSTQLCIEYMKSQLAKQKSILITYAQDSRFSDKHELITHDQRYKISSDYTCTDLQTVPQYLWEDCDTIFIDECQFFDHMIEFTDLVRAQGKHVYCAGLSGDYKREPFPAIGRLIARATDFRHLKGICLKCGRDSVYTSRFNQEKKEQVCIGDLSMYQPVCENCFS